LAGLGGIENVEGGKELNRARIPDEDRMVGVSGGLSLKCPLFWPTANMGFELVRRGMDKSIMAARMGM
jgi:hypothetical protein